MLMNIEFVNRKLISEPKSHEIMMFVSKGMPNNAVVSQSPIIHFIHPDWQ